MRKQYVKNSVNSLMRKYEYFILETNFQLIFHSKQNKVVSDGKMDTRLFKVVSIISVKEQTVKKEKEKTLHIS